MKQWLFVAILASAFFLFGSNAVTSSEEVPTSKESSYQDSVFQQNWACLPQSETRTNHSIASVYFPSLPFKGTILSQIQGLEQSSFLLEQKEKTLLVNHLIQLGLTDIQRIFPFHQFW